jgi:hypothetical protein
MADTETCLSCRKYFSSWEKCIGFSATIYSDIEPTESTSDIEPTESTFRLPIFLRQYSEPLWLFDCDLINLKLFVKDSTVRESYFWAALTSDRDPKRFIKEAASLPRSTTPTPPFAWPSDPVTQTSTPEALTKSESRTPGYTNQAPHCPHRKVTRHLPARSLHLSFLASQTTTGARHSRRQRRTRDSDAHR